uniref:cytoglobin-2-like n=1 Tax=Styela clava TaxID=7725 RepID=UPI001939277B|nr:cytoglobin-2-like [Styela clava]
MSKSLFSADESTALKTSWKTLTKAGIAPVGQLVLHRFFNDVPEVRELFYNVGVDEDRPQSLTMESLMKDNRFREHAKRVAYAIDTVIRNLDETDVIVEKCSELGKIHVKHKVQPHQFDLLGEVLVNVIKGALNYDVTHPIMQAWIKAYGTIASAAKAGMKTR